MKYNYVAGVVTQEGPSGAEGVARRRILISQTAPGHGCPHRYVLQQRISQDAPWHNCPHHYVLQ